MRFKLTHLALKAKSTDPRRTNNHKNNIIYDPPQRNASKYTDAISRFPNTDHTILAQQERETIQQLKSKLAQTKPKRTTALKAGQPDEFFPLNSRGNKGTSQTVRLRQTRTT